MTVPGAIDLISQLAKSMGRTFWLGRNGDRHGDGGRCGDAGAEFLVSPEFDLETVSLANRAGKLVMAGALTPAGIIGLEAGSDLVKIFPCGTVGGAKYIKALKAPLPHIPMVPTGGVNLTTAAEFIQAGASALGVGGELVSAAALQSGNTKEIVEAARKFVSIVRETREQMQKK